MTERESRLIESLKAVIVFTLVLVVAQVGLMAAREYREERVLKNMANRADELLELRESLNGAIVTVPERKCDCQPECACCPCKKVK